MAADDLSNDDVATADAGDIDTTGAPAAAAGDAPTDDELSRVSGELVEMRELAQRTQAEFENFKKRQIRQQTEHLEQAAKSLLEGLLPVLDSFELALGALGDAEEKVRKGVDPSASRITMLASVMKTLSFPHPPASSRPAMIASDIAAFG